MVDAILAVNNLSLSVGKFALRDISFDIDRNDYFVLLGPTGCGKTLLAETICGLNLPHSGSISLAGRDITRSDPSQRRIGYVPQDYALLPFKTVEENIAFGLEAQRLPPREIADRVDEVLSMLDISSLRERRPAKLSGGERQRVALGRALAIRPDLLVLDEPLSALDESTCEEMMRKLRELHANVNMTFLHICHRMEEALTLATLLGVMREGRIEQLGRPNELLSNPRNLFIAKFLRLPGILSGEIRDGAGGRAFYLGEMQLANTDAPDGPANAVMPLEDIALSLSEPEHAEGFVVLAETIVENRTRIIQPGLKLNGTLNITIPGIFPQSDWSAGRQIYLKVPVMNLKILQQE